MQDNENVEIVGEINGSDRLKKPQDPEKLVKVRPWSLTSSLADWFSLSPGKGKVRKEGSQSGEGKKGEGCSD